MVAPVDTKCTPLVWRVKWISVTANTRLWRYAIIRNCAITILKLSKPYHFLRLNCFQAHVHVIVFSYWPKYPCYYPIHITLAGPHGHMSYASSPIPSSSWVHRAPWVDGKVLDGLPSLLWLRSGLRAHATVASASARAVLQAYEHGRATASDDVELCFGRGSHIGSMLQFPKAPVREVGFLACLGVLTLCSLQAEPQLIGRVLWFFPAPAKLGFRRPLLLVITPARVE